LINGFIVVIVVIDHYSMNVCSSRHNRLAVLLASDLKAYVKVLNWLCYCRSVEYVLSLYGLITCRLCHGNIV